MSTTSINTQHAESQFANDPKVIAAAIAQGVASITTVDELPDGLKYLKPVLPGLLFQHHSPDDRIVPQFRPDDPKKFHKYVFPKNVGSVLSINPTMTPDRSIVAIVEGTKQAIFAAAYAPEDVLVVGIQGCDGWSQEGQALATLDALVKGRDVIVVFDADLESNPNVYSAGIRLRKTLEVIGAASVKFASIPGSKNVGLDDFLTRRPEADRGAVFAEILAKSVPFNKIKKPARKVTVGPKNPSFVYVSTKLGEICAVEFERVDDDGIIVREQEELAVAGEVDGRPVRRVETLMYGAATVKSLVTSFDDLTIGVEPSYSYDLTLHIGPEGDCRTYEIRDITDTDLSSPRKWLAKAGEAGLMTELGPNGQLAAGGSRIAEAIRADMKTREFDAHLSRPHSGWIEYDDEVMWTDAGGSHTSKGKRTDVTAQLEGALAPLNIPGYKENYELRDVYHALDQLFAVEDYLVDATAWVAGLSALFWALAGGDSYAVLYILGGRGSGKSSISGLLTSFLSPHWGVGLSSMASADGTAAYLRDLTKQSHNVLLVVDDFRGRSSSRAQDNQADGFENLIRPAYAGGSSAATKKVRNHAGDWVQEKAKPNRFFLCLVGEILPDAERESSIERLLVVEVETKTSMKPAGTTPTGESGHEHFVRLSRSSAFMPITSRFIMSMSKLIANEEGIDKWRDHLNHSRTTAISEKIVARGIEATPRVINLAGTFVAGIAQFLEWVKASKYFDADAYRRHMGAEPAHPRSIDEIRDKWSDMLVAAVQRHAAVNLDSGGVGEMVINRVREAVISGRYNIGGLEAGKTRIGVYTTFTIHGKETECIALLPTYVTQIAQMQFSKSSLRDLLVHDSDNKLTKLVRIDGNPQRCFVLLQSVWNQSSNGESLVASEGGDAND